MPGVSEKACFVVGPIGEPESEVRIHADWLLEEIIQPVFEERGSFVVTRADKIALPGMIDAQVIKHLIDSDIVIADLSFLNPNAFYEIGIRHMVQKPIVHMQLSDDKIPFDVSLYRAIKFSRTRPADIRRARTDLRAALESVLSSEYKIDNPVTRARGQINLELQATPSEKVLVEQLLAIQQRIGNLERTKESSPSEFETHFTRDALHIEHRQFSANEVRDFQRWLKSLFGQRISQIRTKSTFTVADVDIGSMSFEQHKMLQQEIASYKGVTTVNLIPF